MSKKIPPISGVKPGKPYRELVQQYLLMIYQEGFSVTTIQTYGWHLNHFCAWLLENGVYKPGQISPSILLEWGGHLRFKYSPQTQKVCAVAIKSFYKFLVKLQVCSEAVFSDVKNFLSFPKVTISPQRTLTVSEVSRLITISEGDEKKDIRARALILLLLDTGLRAAELCSIKQKDVDINKRKISIVGKGGKWEKVYFGFECQQILQEWLHARMSLSTKNDYLFVSLGGNTPEKQITTRGLRIILKRIGERADVPNVHPHAFRRSFATLRIKNKQSTRGVQQLGRWKNLATFERYTQALIADEDFSRNEASHFSPLKDIS